MAWNDEATIECEFSFKCPKTWGQLTPTEAEGIRYCSECERVVHLALIENDFRRHADEGNCVVVWVLPGLFLEEDCGEVYLRNGSWAQKRHDRY